MRVVSGRWDSIIVAKVFDPRLLALAGVLVGWQIASLFFGSNQLPGLVTLADNVVTVVTGDGRFGFIETNGITLQRIILGFLISMILGTFIGIVMGINHLAEEYFTTPVMTFLAFPSLIWAFLGILWFGLTDYIVPVFVIVMIVTPYVTVNILEGTKDVDIGLVEMAKSFSAEESLVWRYVYLPHLRPYLFASARVAFSMAWKVSLVAEIFGTSSGIGHVVNNYYLSFRSDMIIAWALPVMLLMFGIERLLQRLEKRAFRWRPEVSSEATGRLDA